MHISQVTIESGYTNTHYSTYPTLVTDSVNTFVSSIAYRAWGAVKQMTYANSTQLAMTFNGRMQGTQDQLSLKNWDGSNHTAGSTYDYYDDGKNRQTGVRPAIFAISDLVVPVAARVLHCFSKPVAILPKALPSKLSPAL